MMTDMSLPIKAAVLARLETDAALLVLVPATRIFSMQPPTKPVLPFVRYGYPVVNPFEDSCGKGSEVDVTLSLFASDENTAHRVAAAIVDAMENVSVSFRLVSCDWNRTQFVQIDADTWQGIVQFTMVATA